MGFNNNISATRFPPQGNLVGKQVKVMFHYNEPYFFGKCVRDDLDDPWVTILALDDGRYVLATECQYSF